MAGGSSASHWSCTRSGISVRDEAVYANFPLGIEFMAFTETYRCDVCGKTRGDSEDWWLAWSENEEPVPGAAAQPVLHLTRWNLLLCHSADVKHLCGGQCAQTLLDRWMHAPLGRS